MTWLLLWVFVSIEKIASAFAMGSTVMNWSIAVYLSTYAVGWLCSSNMETMSSNFKKLKRYRSVSVVTGVLGAICLTISMILPDKKELAMIIGGGVTWEVLTSDASKEMGGKVIELLNSELDNAIHDSTNRKKPPVVDTIKDVIDVTKEVVGEDT